MNNFKKGGFGRGGQKFGGKKKFNGPQRDNRSGGQSSELFPATCSDCGKKCNVPFKPSADKPVFCSECFGMKKSANESRGFEHKNNRPQKTSWDSEKTNTTPPKAQPPQLPTNDGILELKRQISGLEVKLNKILDLINPPLPSPKIPQPATEKNRKTASPVPTQKAPAKATKKEPAVKKVVKSTPKKVAIKAAPKTAKKTTTKKAPAKAVKKVKK